MKNKQIFILVLAVFLLSFISFVYASYEFNDHSIQEEYAKDSSIYGQIQISFEDELVNSLFTDSLGNSVKLKELLMDSSDYSYNCERANCESKFNEVHSGNTLSFHLNDGEEAFYGLIFNEKSININSIDFKLVSDATESPTNQISLDFFLDGEIEIENTNVGSSEKEVNFGCFSPSGNELELGLDSTPYCQEILIDKTPGVKIGAWIKEITAGNNVMMTLYDKDGGFLNSCEISKIDITSGGSEEFCLIENYSVLEEENHFGCIWMDGVGDGEYKIQGHSQENNCGFQGTPPGEAVYSYQIGAIEKYFGNVGTIQVQNTLDNGENLSRMVEDYIFSEYGSLDCSSEKCYVPLGVISSFDQDITLKDLDVDYDFEGGSGVTMNNFYRFEEDPSKVSSSSGWLSLGQFFKLPSEEGDLTYSLNYKGDQLFEEEISINDYQINLYPKKAAVGFPTDFSIYVPTALSASLYNWDFGDGNSKITAVPNIKHTYMSEGNFIMELKVSTSIGELQKSFGIEVGPAKEVLRSEIQKRKDNLDIFEESLVSLNLFEKDQVKKVVDVSHLRQNLTVLEEEEAIAITDEEYADIISRLLSLEFPSSLQKGFVGKSFLIPSEESINLGILESITGEIYDNSQRTYDYIRFWNIDNLNSDISHNRIKINWEDGSKSQINLFDLTIMQSKSISEDYYFIIKELENLDFDTGQVIETEGNYKYIQLSSSTESITFSTTEDVKMGENLFISPSKVILGDVEEVSELEVKNWIIVLGVIGVLLVGLLVYLVLHRWYRVKYERHLFPDKNQLY